MTFGERLSELRRDNGFTREAFAKYLGISKYTLRNYELSVNEPNSSFLKQVSDIFDVSIDYLMGATDEKERILPYQLKTSEWEHIKKYRTLDPHGKDMVDTVLIKEYDRCDAEQKMKNDQIVNFSQQTDRSYLDPVAAHERTDIEITDEMKKHDDDLMDDPDIWK